MTTTITTMATPPADGPNSGDSSEATKAAEEESGSESMAADAADGGDSSDAKESSAMIADADDGGGGLSVDCDSADRRVVGEDEDEEGKSENGPQTPRRDNVAAAIIIGSPQSPIDYTSMDSEDVPFEHNFEPGDHIIRWDMLPILWPIQIHGIVLEVSEDKSEVTICDFGVTSVKTTEDKKIDESQNEEKIVEEENAIFNEAIQDVVGDDDATNTTDELSVATDTSTTKNKNEQSSKKKKQQQQRLHVRKLTKWSDLKKWHKVNYEGGLLSMNKDGMMGKGLKNLGKKTEKLWTSMTKSFARNDEDVPKEDDDAEPKDTKKLWLSVRHDVDGNGYCVHHPDVQLKRLKDNGKLAMVRKKCPECIMEDCPAMMGEESPKLTERKSWTEEETSPKEESNNGEEGSSEYAAPSSTSSTRRESSPSSNGDIDGPPSEDGGGNADVDPTEESDKMEDEPLKEGDEPQTLAQMISQANEIEKRNRKILVMSPPSSPQKNPPSSPQKKPAAEKQKSWHGSLMKSWSSVFSQKDDKDASASVDPTADEKQTNGDSGKELNSDKQSNTTDSLPRSDPPILVLARTRFILEHGESVLPPYHIINSNSECIAVWCKTGRWSTLQASVFLHSTAIGHAKSATALTLGVAATQPWLIPAFATVGLAAVGTPWLFLKVANDKWNAATMSLTEKFWMQAEPEVFVECIDKWGKIK